MASKTRGAAKQSRSLAPGDFVLVELRTDLFALIWIITAAKKQGFTFLVMTGTWSVRPAAKELRTARPAPSDGAAMLPDRITQWKGWISGRIPRGFDTVGHRQPSAATTAYAEDAIGTMVFGTAERLREHLLHTWRSKHERKAVEAEARAEEDRRRREDAARRAAMTLPMMLRERIFADWADHWPPRVVREARRIFSDATTRLIALKRNGTRRQRIDALRQITTELNVLDDKEGFIETVEREEVVARIEELARLVGVTNAREQLTGHRDW